MFNLFTSASCERVLQEVYESKSLDSIDLMVGGVAEANVRGGAVGPTFACIIGNFETRIWNLHKHSFVQINTLYVVV